MDGSRRLAWLEDYAATFTAAADRPVRRSFTTASISIMSRSRIPARPRLVLEDISLTFPAGKVIAIVGENGAGKTTLVKLSRKMYEPSSGAILWTTCRFARHAGRRVALAAGGSVSGFLPL